VAETAAMPELTATAASVPSSAASLAASTCARAGSSRRRAGASAPRLWAGPGGPLRCGWAGRYRMLGRVCTQRDGQPQNTNVVRCGGGNRQARTCRPHVCVQECGALVHWHDNRAAWVLPRLSWDVAHRSHACMGTHMGA